MKKQGSYVQDLEDLDILAIKEQYKDKKAQVLKIAELKNKVL